MTSDEARNILDAHKRESRVTDDAVGGPLGVSGETIMRWRIGRAACPPALPWSLAARIARLAPYEGPDTLALAIAFPSLAASAHVRAWRNSNAPRVIGWPVAWVGLAIAALNAGLSPVAPRASLAVCAVTPSTWRPVRPFLVIAVGPFGLTSRDVPARLPRSANDHRGSVPVP